MVSVGSVMFVGLSQQKSIDLPVLSGDIGTTVGTATVVLFLPIRVAS